MFCFERQLRAKGEENYGTWLTYILLSTVRVLEFVTGLVVIGLYAQDIHSGSSTGSAEGQLYGVIVGILSSITSLVLIAPHIRPALTFWWDCIVFLLYIVLFSVWAKPYLSQTDPGLGNTTDKNARLHHSVYVDAAALALWLVSAMYSTLKFVRAYRARKGMGGPSEMEQIA